MKRWYRDWEFKGVKFRSFFHEVTKKEITKILKIDPENIIAEYEPGLPFCDNTMILFADKSISRLSNEFQAWLEEAEDWWSERDTYSMNDVVLLEKDEPPLSKGGAHDASNIVPACRSCNSKNTLKY